MFTDFHGSIERLVPRTFSDLIGSERSATHQQTMTQPGMEPADDSGLLQALQNRLEKQREEQRAEAERLQQEREDLQRLSNRQSSQAVPTSDSLGDGGRTFFNF